MYKKNGSVILSKSTLIFELNIVHIRHFSQTSQCIAGEKGYIDVVHDVIPYPECTTLAYSHIDNIESTLSADIYYGIEDQQCCNTLY